jgi:serine/threonine protein kinase
MNKKIIKMLLFGYLFFNAPVFAMKNTNTSIDGLPTARPYSSEESDDLFVDSDLSFDDLLNTDFVPKKLIKQKTKYGSRIKEIKKPINLINQGSFKIIYGYEEKAFIFFKRSPHHRLTKDDIFRAELNFYKNYRHKNIISMVDYSEEDQIIVLELGKMDLIGLSFEQKTKLNSDFKKLNLIEKLKIFKDIAEGIKYLHDNELIHGDLKRSNVIIMYNEKEQRFIAKLIDMQSAEKVCDGAKCFSSMYNVPEQHGYNEKEMENKNIDQFKVEIYTLGALFYHTLFDSNKLSRSLRTYKNSLDYYQKLDLIKNDTLKELIIQCLNTDPSERPNINEILLKLDEIILEEKTLGKRKKYKDRIRVIDKRKKYRDLIRVNRELKKRDRPKIREYRNPRFTDRR